VHWSTKILKKVFHEGFRIVYKLKTARYNYCENSFIEMDYKRELISFKEYLDRRVQPGTADLYIYVLGRWFDQLDGDTPSQASGQSYIDSLARAGKSPSTISTRAHAIMRYFKWKGQPISLDCPTIRMGEPDYLMREQVQKVIDACKTPLENALIIVLFDTAIRISELLNLELDDIDRNFKLISVIRKGGRREEVNISDKALDTLDRWLEARQSTSKRVFMDIRYWEAWHLIKSIGKRVKIDLHPHTFRHSRAVQMLLSGADLHDVQVHLGHKSITTTANIYGRFKAIHARERIPSW